MKMCSLRLRAEFSVLVAGFWENRCLDIVIVCVKKKRENMVDPQQNQLTKDKVI